MTYDICFISSIIFFFVYLNVSTILKKKMLKESSENYNPLWIKMTIAIGIIFIFAQLLVLPFIFDKKAFIGTLFLWFCGSGIFSVLTMRILYGLFKCLKQNKEVNSSASEL